MRGMGRMGLWVICFLRFFIRSMWFKCWYLLHTCACIYDTLRMDMWQCFLFSVNLHTSGLPVLYIPLWLCGHNQSHQGLETTLRYMALYCPDCLLNLTKQWTITSWNWIIGFSSIHCIHVCLPKEISIIGTVTVVTSQISYLPRS